MHIKNSFSLLCSLALALAACGEVVPVDGAQVDASPEDRIDAMTIGACEGDNIAVDDLLDCFITAQCEWLVACQAFAPTVQACIDRVEAEGAFELERTLDAVAAGRTTYDGAEAALCLDGIDTNDCSFQPGEDCDKVFVGTILDGGSCYTQDECAGIDADCQYGDCQDQCCLGNCLDEAPLGADCTNRQCVDGTHCASLPGNPAMSQCVSGNLNTPCGNDNHCDEDLYCEPALSTCQPALGENASCDQDSQCLEPLDCVGSDAGTGGAGTCVFVDSVNDECDDSCEGNLYCLPGPNVGTCQLKEGDGGICSFDSQCQPQLYCNDAQSRCRMPPRLDEACERFSCAPGLFCTNELPGADGNTDGTCAEPVVNGLSCDSDSHCETGVCANQSCEDYLNCYL